MEHQIAGIRCQRIGCNASFTEDDNPEGSCQYHDSPWVLIHRCATYSCACFNTPHILKNGCKIGKHTTEKPVLTKSTTAVKKPSPTPVASMTNTLGKESCARCQQGFFCSDHGTQVKGNNKSINETSSIPAASSIESQAPPAPAKKIVGINEPQICKNKGCGKTFTEMENHDTACSYHPGPAIFHDRLRGWKCCNIHVKEFDEFMEIPPCTRGWHNADPA
ncbi:cysteine and histidine-rich domain-containing protein RAR1 isoform X3 [Benincasa hispida]|uniref:cysteine and histidine-rich domain-containing protein RAR1 isoform X3 n=1 Tax=Benincasa hispida TaxID=102211 RepID=UPI001901E36F|nr:cysteine and histidine-rich domain-containing protein RAR1 isoform X3 [Benincasa hispida]